MTSRQVCGLPLPERSGVQGDGNDAPGKHLAISVQGRAAQFYRVCRQR